MHELHQAIALNTFLSQLTPDVRDALLQGTVARTAHRGELLYQVGDPPAVALMVSGLVRAFLKTGSDRQATIWYGRSGDFIALEAVFTPPRHLHLQALEDSSAIVWPIELLRDRLRDNAALLWEATAEISRRLNLMFEELAGNIFGTVRQRLARHLLELAVPDASELVVTSSAQALALAVGTAREVVSRALRDLANEGIIRTQRGSVTVMDATRLYAESCAHEKR